MVALPDYAKVFEGAIFLVFIFVMNFKSRQKKSKALFIFPFMKVNLLPSYSGARVSFFGNPSHRQGEYALP